MSGRVGPLPPSFINTYSLDFDGVDDNVYLQNLTSRKVQTLTMSVWVKPTAFARDGIVLNGNPSYGNEGIRIDWVFNTFKTAINGVFYELGPGNGQNNWTHIAIAYDGNTLKRMTNGVQFSDVFVGATINYTNYNGLHLGRSTSGFHIGNIDEFAFWDSDQSANFSTIYNNGIPNNLSSLNPLSWYRMGDNGAYKSPQWLLPSNENKDKVSNYSLDFDGVDDYVNAGASTLSGETALSISAWVYPTAYGDATAPSFVSTDEASPRAFYLGLYNGTNFRFSLSTNGANLTSLDTGIGTVDLNTWQHILVTWDQVNLKLYKNGVLLKTVATTFASNGTFTTTNDLLIGARRPTDGLFEGKIDEVAIFNSVVDIADVWDGSGEPIDVSAVSGIVSNYRMGEDASFNGTNWTVPDNVGSNNGTSNAMTIQDRVGTAPSSSNNAVSFNMDLVDRVTDVPT